MPHKGYGFEFGAYSYFHDLFGCIPSWLQNFLVPDPAQFPAPPPTKSSEFPLSTPPPGLSWSAGIGGLTILTGLCKAVCRLSHSGKQIWSLAPPQFLASYITKESAFLENSCCCLCPQVQTPEMSECQTYISWISQTQLGKTNPAQGL